MCVFRLCVILLLFFSVVVIIMFANARPNWAHQQVPGFSFRLSDLKFQFQLVYFFSMRICLGVCVCVNRLQIHHACFVLLCVCVVCLSVSLCGFVFVWTRKH